MNRDLLCGVAATLVALPGCDSYAVDWDGGVTSSSAHLGCPQGGGCYYNGEVRTTRAFEPHELIHAYVGPHWGQSAPVLKPTC
ncbi:hypothetical protein [Sorangium sp. So ce1000]|uniref:hypothetical protein n=1 Tax=Sorangium sp. So ce1000 TaxID=3133325 RepID=UPI003F637F75